MTKPSPKPLVFLLITNYGYGGAERVFSQLSFALSEEYNIIKIVFNNDISDIYPSPGESISLDVSAGKNILWKGIKFLQRCWRLHKLKKKYRPKFTISHLEGANFVNVLSFGKAILCVHGSKTAYDENRKGLIKFFENYILTPLLYNNANKVVTVSYGIARELISSFNVKKRLINTIQNGIDIDYIERQSKVPLSENEHSLFKKPTVVFSGRLAPQKNPLVLIDIYHRMKRRDDVNLLIIGDGPLKKKMIDRCKTLDITFYDEISQDCSDVSGVIFLGYYNNPFKLLKHATVFTLTSDFEGFPLAPCEAMAVGLPVIATDCPTGVREILAPSTSFYSVNLKEPEYAEYGILMPLGSDEKLIDVWAKIISEKIFDRKWLEETASLSKSRALQLSLEKFRNKWLELLSE